MASEEFEEKYQKALREIDRIRQERTSEFATVNANAQKTFHDLPLSSPTTGQIWKTRPWKPSIPTR